MLKDFGIDWNNPMFIGSQIYTVYNMTLEYQLKAETVYLLLGLWFRKKCSCNACMLAKRLFFFFFF